MPDPIRAALEKAEAAIDAVRNNEQFVLAYKKLLLSTLYAAQGLNRDVIADANEVFARLPELAPSRAPAPVAQQAASRDMDAELSAMYDHDILR